MKSSHSIVELSVLLAFAKLEKVGQDRFLAAVNEYLLASLPQRELMVAAWENGMDYSKSRL